MQPNTKLKRDEKDRAIAALLEQMRAAQRQLFELVYDDVKIIADRLMAKERKGHTYSPTVVADELWMKFDQSMASNPDHFFALATRKMKHILIDYARKRVPRKDLWERAAVDLNLVKSPNKSPDVGFRLDLNNGLKELRQKYPDRFEAFVLKLNGWRVSEISFLLEVDVKKLESMLKTAQAVLKRAIGK